MELAVAHRQLARHHGQSLAGRRDNGGDRVGRRIACRNRSHEHVLERGLYLAHLPQHAAPLLQGGAQGVGLEPSGSAQVDAVAEDVGQRGRIGALQNPQGGALRVGVQLQHAAADVCPQLRRGVAGEETAHVHQGNPGAPLGLVHIGRGDDDGRAAQKRLVQDRPKLTAGHRVDAGGGLIEQQQRRLVDEGAAQGQFLLHAPRQVPCQPLAMALQSGEGEQPGFALALLGGWHPVQVCEKVEVLLHREPAVEAEHLRHVADAGVDRGGVADGVGPQHARLTRARPHDGGKHLQRRGLARAVGAEQSEDLTLGDGQGEAVDCLAGSVDFGQPGGHDRAAHGCSTRGASPPSGHRASSGCGHRLACRASPDLAGCRSPA